MQGLPFHVAYIPIYTSVKSLATSADSKKQLSEPKALISPFGSSPARSSCFSRQEMVSNEQQDLDYGKSERWES